MFYSYFLLLLIVCMYVGVGLWVCRCDCMWVCYCVYSYVYYMGVLFCVCMDICMWVCMPWCACGCTRQLNRNRFFHSSTWVWRPRLRLVRQHASYPLSISCQPPCFVCLFKTDFMYSRLVLNSLSSSKWPWISNHDTSPSEVLGLQRMYTRQCLGWNPGLCANTL